MRNAADSATITCHARHDALRFAGDSTDHDLSVSATMRALREESEEWSDHEQAWFRKPLSILDSDE